VLKRERYGVLPARLAGEIEVLDLCFKMPLGA